MVGSGQEDLVDLFRVDDIEFMKKFADTFVDDTDVVLTSKKGEGGKRHNGKTISLNIGLNDDIKTAVQSIVKSQMLMQEEDMEGLGA